MTSIIGAYPCPGCGASVTAWRDNRRAGPVFDADHFNPYLPHVCRIPDSTLSRIAGALEGLRLLAVETFERTEQPPRERTPAQPAAATAAARAGTNTERAHLRAVPRADTAPAQGARPVAGDTNHNGNGPRPGFIDR